MAPLNARKRAYKARQVNNLGQYVVQPVEREDWESINENIDELNEEAVNRNADPDLRRSLNDVLININKKKKQAVNLLEKLKNKHV